MSEVYDQWPDADPHFVREFQTSGFDARTWELYLRAALLEMGFYVDSVDHRPDFRCAVDGKTFFVEATTANPSSRPPPPRTTDEYFARLSAATVEYDEIAIRFGSALFSKQKKQYHELDHVKGKPLVFAIEGFHDEGSLFHADTPLLRYLYGLSLVRRLAPGVALPVPGTIAEHRSGKKVIPSGWFQHSGNENVSAVLFSNAGTISKFNRIGFQRGDRHPRVATMMRCGLEFDPEPGSMRPIPFTEDVAHTNETWAEDLVLIHNPVAALPVEPSWFPNITHIFATEEQLQVLSAPRHVFSSFTAIVQTRKP